MNFLEMLLYVLAMASVTYLIRVIPFAFFRKKIKSRYINSILYYLPYTVLSAMTFPFVFYSTGGNIFPAIAGCVVAVVASVNKRSLITVAILSCLAVLTVSFITICF